MGLYKLTLRSVLGALLLASLTPLVSSNTLADPTKAPTKAPTPSTHAPTAPPTFVIIPSTPQSEKCRKIVEDSIKEQGDGGAINGYKYVDCPMEVCLHALGHPMEDDSGVYVKGTCKPTSIMKCQVQPSTNLGFQNSITKRCVVSQLKGQSELFVAVGMFVLILLCCCCCRRSQRKSADIYESTYCCCPSSGKRKQRDQSDPFDKHNMDGDSISSPLLGTDDESDAPQSFAEDDDQYEDEDSEDDEEV
jgi:hypothetical protein